MPDDALTRERVREALRVAAEELPASASYAYDRGADWAYVASLEGAGAVCATILAALDDPARWCGVVGTVEPSLTHDVDCPQSDGPSTYARNLPTLDCVCGATGRLIVTPHQEGA